MLALADIVMPLGDPKTLTRNGDDNRDLVAYLRYHQFDVGGKDETWVISDIYVSPFKDYRGRGMASSMLDELLKKANDVDATVVLHVAASEGGSLTQEQLVEWYHRHGFKDHNEYSKFGPVMVSV